MLHQAQDEPQQPANPPRQHDISKFAPSLTRESCKICTLTSLLQHLKSAGATFTSHCACLLIVVILDYDNVHELNCPQKFKTLFWRLIVNMFLFGWIKNKNLSIYLNLILQLV